jgi:hypothetical protein
MERNSHPDSHDSGVYFTEHQEFQDKIGVKKYLKYLEWTKVFKVEFTSTLDTLNTLNTLVHFKYF